MATLYSDQMTARTAVPPRRVKPSEGYARMRCIRWTFTTPTATVAINDNVQLVEIPAGAVFLDGYCAWTAMSSGGAAASLQIGITGNLTKYLGTTSVDAAGSTSFGNTIALNFMEQLTDNVAGPTVLLATAVTEAWAAAQTFKGFVRVLVD